MRESSEFDVGSVGEEASVFSLGAATGHVRVKTY